MDDGRKRIKIIITSGFFTHTNELTEFFWTSKNRPRFGMFLIKRRFNFGIGVDDGPKIFYGFLIFSQTTFCEMRR